MVTNSTKMRSLFQGVEYRVVRTRAELEKAYHLVYKEYLNQGYVDESVEQLRLSLHNALPETTTFIAMADDHVMATATIMSDSPLCLPMDELYHDELDELRLSGKSICEVSMLASNSEVFGEGIPVMLNAKKMFLVFFLFKHIFDYVKIKLQNDYICITVNPKHANTYDSLFFQDLSTEVKYYNKVNGAPAVAKYLEVQAVNSQCAVSGRKSFYKMFLTGEPDVEKFSGKIQLRPEDLKYFFDHKTSSFEKATGEELSYIKECYPDYNFSDIISQPA